MMTQTQIFMLWGALLAVMLACRCLPLLVLGGRTIPKRAERAIALIPVAAFAALVVNDLVQIDAYAADPRLAAVVFGSAAAVYVVGRKTGSLIWCALTGMGSYALLGMLLG